MDITEKMGIYEETLQVWGVKAQIGKLNEELFELGVAANHWYDDKVDDMDFAEEIADVQIMLNQMKYLVGHDEVDLFVISKLAKLRGRINECVDLEQKFTSQTMEQKTLGSFISTIKNYVKNAVTSGE